LDRPDDNYEIRLRLEDLVKRLERSESEIRLLKDKFVLQEEFDAIVQV
jgi:hypothetical protein